MHAPKRPWSAPPHEDIPPISRIRSIPTWQEPPQEDRLTTTSRPFRLLSAKPKSKLFITYNSTEITRSFKYQFESCSFPRFKKLRILKPDQSHEKVVALRKKNNDTWVSILSHLHRYSCLYQKTADSRYQEEHISIYPMSSQITTRSAQRDTSKIPRLATFCRMVWTFWISSGKYYDILSAGFYLWSYTSDTVTVPNIQYEGSFSIIEIFCAPSRSLGIDRNSGDTGYQWLYFNYKTTSKSSRSISLTIPCDCILWKLRAGWQKTTIFETDSGMRLIYVLDRTQISRSSANTSNQDLTYRGCTMCSLWTE